MISELDKYDIEALHEGCLSESGNYFQDLQKALFIASKVDGFSLELSIGSMEGDLDSTEILEFNIEVSSQAASGKRQYDYVGAIKAMAPT